VILVLGGTTEGRLLAAALEDQGWPVVLYTATALGGEVARQKGVRQVQSRALDLNGFLEIIGEGEVEALIDATHPYAVQVSQTALQAAQLTGAPYLRYERQGWEPPRHPLLLKAADYQGAVAALKNLGSTIFFTIGSKNLKLFARAPELKGKRLTARVLPQPEVLIECLGLGLGPTDILAAQGPFSAAANLWMFQHFEAAAVVSKESGNTGGVQAKWEACLKLAVPLVLIERPRLNYPLVTGDLAGVTAFLHQNGFRPC